MSNQNAILIKMGNTILGFELEFVREIAEEVTLFDLPVKLPDISHITILRGTPVAILNSEYFFLFEHKVREKVIFLTGNIGFFIDGAVEVINLAKYTDSSKNEYNYPHFIKYVIMYNNEVVPIADIKEIMKDVPETHFISI
jgi:chemotaxis signal transduction protein